jgi:ribosomal peptide maturation radical SAM protein 1
LALARAIRELHPNVKIVFGGANFDGEMGQEYLRVLPYIDFVVGGEGERPLLALLDDLTAGGTGTGIAGVSVKDCSNQSVLASPPASPLQDIDELPDPDYEEYFATLFRLGREKVLGDSPPLLLYESARGCWWGQKHHCTFCGLNNSNMAFRSRSPQKLKEQLRRMADRYKIINFEAVDNIMDLSYLKGLFEPIASERLDYQLFYELKSNLVPSQLRTLARAGVRTVQPGIESLSTHVLRLMRKGVSMIQNVRFLKWAHYYGMRVGWNILTGFPGETIEDYQLQLDIIPLLQHLPPPSGCGPIWLERFSPFYFDKSFPIREIRPRPAYRFIYPEEIFDIRKIAYFFDHESDIQVPAQMYSDLYALVERWKGSWADGSPPVMVYQRAPDWIQIIDRRTDEVTVHAVSGWEALAYEFCGETEGSVASIAQRLKDHHHEVSPECIKESLDDLCAQGLMLGEDGRYFSLAFPVNANW